MESIAHHMHPAYQVHTVGSADVCQASLAMQIAGKAACRSPKTNAILIPNAQKLESAVKLEMSKDVYRCVIMFNVDLEPFVLPTIMKVNASVRRGNTLVMPMICKLDADP